MNIVFINPLVWSTIGLYIGFIVISIFYIIVAEVFQVTLISLIVKPIPIWIITLHTASRFRRAYKRNYYILSWTVIFSISQFLHSLGDILLSFAKHNVMNYKIAFTVGASLFFIGHILNIYVFVMKNSKEKPFGYFRIWLYIPYAIITAAIITCIIIFVPEPKPSIAFMCLGGIYFLVLGIAAWRAAARVKHPGENNIINLIVAIGYIIFIVSDTLLTLRNLKIMKINVKVAGILVIVTYYLASALIAFTVDREDPPFCSKEKTGEQASLLIQSESAPIGENEQQSTAQ